MLRFLDGYMRVTMLVEVTHPAGFIGLRRQQQVQTSWWYSNASARLKRDRYRFAVTPEPILTAAPRSEAFNFPAA
jgi:hypothetical protein